MIGRRKFLFNCGTLAAALGLSPTLLLTGCQPDENGTGFDLEAFNSLSGREKYKAFLNELYFFRDSELQLETLAELISVEEIPGSPSTDQPDIDKFALVFKSRPGSTELPAGMYSVSNEKLGEFYLYIEPAQGEDNSIYYTADFCLLADFQIPDATPV